MLLFNQQKQISFEFRNILIPSSNEYILDLESLLHLEEKSNYFNNNTSEDKATVCIIGSIHLQNNLYKSFQDFTINDLSIEQERNILQNWLNTLKPADDNNIQIFHLKTLKKFIYKI